MWSRKVLIGQCATRPLGTRRNRTSPSAVVCARACSVFLSETQSLSKIFMDPAGPGGTASGLVLSSNFHETMRALALSSSAS